MADTAAAITKKEAVRQALTALGKDAKLPALQGFIKEKFKYELSTNHIAAARADVLKRTGKAKPAAPRPAAAASPKGGTAKANGLTKLDAVKKVLADLGMDTRPLQIRDELKKRYKIEISLDVASGYKKKLVKEARLAGGKPATPPAAAPRPAPQKSAARKAPTAPKPSKSPAPKAATPAKADGSSITLADIKAVKGLVKQVGAGQVQNLVAMVGRIGAGQLGTLIELLSR
jgi:hypothetical protein